MRSPGTGLAPHSRLEPLAAFMDGPHVEHDPCFNERKNRRKPVVPGESGKWEYRLYVNRCRGVVNTGTERGGFQVGRLSQDGFWSFASSVGTAVNGIAPVASDAISTNRCRDRSVPRSHIPFPLAGGYHAAQLCGWQPAFPMHDRLVSYRTSGWCRLGQAAAIQFRKRQPLACLCRCNVEAGLVRTTGSVE
jgi:hypothetical protein